MKAVIQRVDYARVIVNQKIVGQIGKGLFILLGVSHTDDEDKCDYLSQKCENIRIFSDENDRMNLSLKDVGGEILVVSQFTLLADCQKGNRPSFIDAARRETATALYERFIANLKDGGNLVQTGIFGADMSIQLQNNGPVTIIMDTDLMMKEKKYVSC